MKKLLFNIKGSRCDYSFHTQESDYARRMYNMRIVTDKDAGTYVLENELGTTLCTCTQKPNVTSYSPTTYGFPPSSTHTLIGCYYVQNKLYLFFAKNNRIVDPKDLVFEVTISNTSYQIKTLAEENLNFNKEHPLLIVSYYESEVLHKLYFIDGINYLTSIKINEYNGVYKVNTLSSINSQLSSISFNVYVQDGGGTFKPSIRSYGCIFLDAYGITTNCILDNIKYEIANYDGKPNAPDTVLNKAITVKVYFDLTIKDAYEYIKLYSFSRESYYGETIVLSVYKSNANINLKTATREGDKYFVTFIDYNNGEADTINNILLSSLNIISNAISTNSEYLLLGNNKYSSNSAVEEIVKLDKTMVDITFSQEKLVIVSNSSNSNLNYEGFCAEPQTVINNTKYYFKSGEQYRLGYLLYYDKGNISDIIPLAYNSQGFTVKIPSYNNTAVTENNGKYYTKKYIIYIRILPSGLKLLKNANVVSIKFYFLLNEPSEKKIFALCAFLPAILFYYTNYLRFLGIISDCNKDSKNSFCAPMTFFRPGYTKDNYLRYNFCQPIRPFSKLWEKKINSSTNYLDIGLKYNNEYNYSVSRSDGFVSNASCFFTDYPYLFDGTMNTAQSQRAFSDGDFNIVRLAPNVGELISADIGFADNSLMSMNNLLLCYAGLLFHSICAYNNTGTNSNVPLYVLGHANYGNYAWKYSGDTGTSDNVLTDYFCYSPQNNMWWALSRGSIDLKAFVINKFLYPALLDYVLDINILTTGLYLHLPTFKFMNITDSGYAYRDANNIYPSYMGITNLYNTTFNVNDFGKPNANGFSYSLGYLTEDRAKRTITCTWKNPRKQKSILCYFPINVDNNAPNLAGYVGPYAWLNANDDSTTPILELLLKKVTYNVNNQNWIEALSVPVYKLYFSKENFIHGQSFILDIGDTTISLYLYEVANVNGNDNFTAKVSSVYGDTATDAQIMSYKSYDPASNPCSVNSYVICPLETQLSLYYENFNLSTLLNKSWDFKEADLVKINNVFNDRRSFLLFLQYNEAEIKGTELKNEIIALGPKLPNELNDRWLNLSNNNILTYYLNGEYGAINSLKSIDNAVYAFTDKAIFKVGFNLTSSIPSSTLYLLMARNPSFTGDYIIAEVGCNDNEKVLQTTNGLYLLSNTHKELYSIQGDKVSAMGLMKFNKSALQHFNYDKWNPYYNSGAKLRYNAHYNELYILDGGDKQASNAIERSDENLTLKRMYYLDDDKIPRCLAYSELLGEFTSYYDYWYSPYWFFIGNTQYSISEDNKIYLMHTGKYSLFYLFIIRDGFKTKNIPICSQVSFTIIHNLEIDKNKTLYSISYSGGLYTKNTPIDLRKLAYSNTTDMAGYTETKRGFLISAVEKLRIKNDYQDTGIIDVSQNLTSGINSYIPQYSKQKLLTWNILIPRDSFKTIGMNKYKNQRMLNTWNEITVALPTTTDEFVYGNKAAKIWSLTLNYN